MLVEYYRSHGLHEKAVEYLLQSDGDAAEYFKTLPDHDLIQVLNLVKLDEEKILTILRGSNGQGDMVRAFTKKDEITIANWIKQSYSSNLLASFYDLLLNSNPREDLFKERIELFVSMIDINHTSHEDFINFLSRLNQPSIEYLELIPESFYEARALIFAAHSQFDKAFHLLSNIGTGKIVQYGLRWIEKNCMAVSLGIVAALVNFSSQEQKECLTEFQPWLLKSPQVGGQMST